MHATLQPARLSRRSRWLAVLLGVAGLLAAAVSIFLHGVERRWRAMVAIGAEIEAAEQRRDCRRPVLWGDSHPGNAWPEYRRALEWIARQPNSQARWIDWIQAAAPLDKAVAMAAYLLPLQPAFAPLRRGAHGATARPEIEWARGFDHPTCNLLTTRWLLNAVVLDARRLAGQGDDVAAAHRLLDGMQIGRDLLQSAQIIDEMIGVALVAIATKQALLDAGPTGSLLDQLSPDALAVLDDGMRRLDEGLPATRTAPGIEVALFVRHVTGPAGPRLGKPGPGGWETWRYGFSERGMLAHFVQERFAQVQRLERVAGQPWSLRDGVVAEVARAMESSGNPLSRMWGGVRPGLQSRLIARTWLRLARAAVAVRRRGVVPALADPFGDGLQSRCVEGRWEIWSAGRRGPLAVTLQPVR